MTPVSALGLVKTFGPQRALDDVSVEIARGELFFLLGPSGCGKTTLLRSIAGFYVLDAGRILFGDVDVTHVPPQRRNTAMVFQNYALWPHMSVEANVAFGLCVRRVGRAERRRRAAEALDMVRMGQYARRKPNQLSGGQQQRVALARALVVRPQCLLLDEPLSNLDAKLRLDMRIEIRRLCKQFGLTGIYVTHDQAEALSIADRMAVMFGGRIAQVGSPRELYCRPASSAVAAFIGETNLLAATVMAAQGDAVKLATRIGALDARFDRVAGPVGEKFTVSIRPEAIALVATPESNKATHKGDIQYETLAAEAIHLAGSPASGAGRPNLFSARVMDRTYLGDATQFLLAVGEQSLRACGAERAGIATIEPGRDVICAVDPRDVVILPE